MTEKELYNQLEEYDKTVIKLSKEIKKLKETINKSIKLLEEDYFEDGSGYNVEEVIKILKGEENE